MAHSFSLDASWRRWRLSCRSRRLAGAVFFAGALAGLFFAGALGWGFGGGYVAFFAAGLASLVWPLTTSCAATIVTGFGAGMLYLLSNATMVFYWGEPAGSNTTVQRTAFNAVVGGFEALRAHAAQHQITLQTAKAENRRSWARS